MQKLAYILAFLAAFWAAAAHGADPMTVAHRTTGSAPLGVMFDAVDTVEIDRDTSLITGLTINYVNNLSPTGTGTFVYTVSTNEITYQAPGDTAGTATTLSADAIDQIIYSNNGNDFARFDVDFSALPVGDQTDTITITTENDSGVLQPAAEWIAGVPDYGKLTYQWWFGDGNAITYSYTAANRNSDTCHKSPITAHLYAEPGTYTARLSVWDETGTRHDYEQTITVTDQEDTATIYFVDATGGDDMNDGLTPANALQTWDSGMGKITTVDDVIVKIKRGETYSTSASKTITASDIMVTSYFESDGSDNTGQPLPIITVSGTNSLIEPGPGEDDIKLCHLDVNGPGATAGAFTDIGRTTAQNNFLVWDVDVNAMSHLATMTGSNNRWNNKHQFIVSCRGTNLGSTSGNGLFLGMVESAVLGVKLDEMVNSGEHCFRAPHHYKSIIADSQFDNPNDNKSCLTVRGNDYGSTHADGVTDPWTKPNGFTAVLRNRCFSPAGAASAVATGSGSTGVDIRLEQLWIHDNFVETTDSSPYIFSDRFLTATRNIAKGPVSNGYSFTSNSLLPPNYHHFFHNVFVTDSATGGTRMLAVLTGVDGTTNLDPINIAVKGNIAYRVATMDAGIWSVQRADENDLDSDYNLLDSSAAVWSFYRPDGLTQTSRTLAQTQTDLSQDANSDDTGSVSFTNAAEDDFRLAAGSNGIDDGDSGLLPWIRLDADGNLVTGTPDLGAYERGASPPPTQQSSRKLVHLPGVLFRESP